MSSISVALGRAARLAPLLLVALSLALAPPAGAKKDKKSKDKKDRKQNASQAADASTIPTIQVAWDPASSTHLGSYAGDSFLGLRTVQVSESASLGDGLSRVPGVRIVHADGRQAGLERAVRAFLEATGLLAGPGRPAGARVAVVARRYRVSTFPDGLRAEVFLELTFTRNAKPLGRVLACGTAEHRTSDLGSEAAIGALFQAAFDDALQALVTSQTFARVVGEGWTPGPGPALPKSPAITRIDRARVYAPSQAARDTLPQLRAVLVDTGGQPISLDDLAVRDVYYLEKKDGSLERAERSLPDALLAQLGAFYPGALDRARRTRGWPKGGGKGLVVTGSVLRYDPGGSHQKLRADLYLKDGATAVDRFALHVDWTQSGGAKPARELPAGAHWVGYPAETTRMPELEEALARDLAYLLVMSRPGGTTPPQDLEVRFGGEAALLPLAD